MIHLRRMTVTKTGALSVFALCVFSAPLSAQQSIIYNDPVYQPQGQVFQPQQPSANQPAYFDTNTGQFVPLPQTGFGQQPPPSAFEQQQPFSTQPQAPFGQAQPQPFYGEPLPEPGFGSPLPQPGQGYVRQQPGQPSLPAQPQPPQPGLYYDRAGSVPPVSVPGQPLPNPPAVSIPQQSVVLPEGVNPQPAVPARDLPASGAAPADTGAVASRKSSASSAFAAGEDRASRMAAELDALLAIGERYRAASPGFLEDLKVLAKKYREPLPDAQAGSIGSADNSTLAQQENAALPSPETRAEVSAPEKTVAPEPAESEGNIVTSVAPLDPNSVSVAFFEDNFTDGEFQSNPAWRVRQGDWSIDPKFGLRAKLPGNASATQINPKDLLKNLLDGGDTNNNGSSTGPRAALIETQTPVGNAFAMAARVVDHAGTGTAHFILHQGGANWLGYRLELRSGPQPVVVLTRRGSNGYKDITKVSAPGFTKGKQHEIRWVRLSNGQMIVLLNGNPVITSRDTVFREDWKGFAFFNAGGDVSIRAIRVSAPVER